MYLPPLFKSSLTISTEKACLQRCNIRINHHVFTTESKKNNWYLQIVINFIFTDILKVTMKFPHEVPF